MRYIVNLVQFTAVNPSHSLYLMPLPDIGKEKQYWTFMTADSEKTAVKAATADDNLRVLEISPSLIY